MPIGGRPPSILGLTADTCERFRAVRTCAFLLPPCSRDSNTGLLSHRPSRPDRPRFCPPAPRIVPQAPTPGRKSSLTRALGLRASVEVDTIVTPLLTGDRLLLCTDGLSDHLDLAALRRLFAMALQHAATAAIQHALRSGGRDTITALFIDIAV